MKKKLLYITIFLIVSSIFSFIIFSLIKDRKKDYLEVEKELVRVTFNTVVKAFKVHSDIIYFNKINSTYIKEQLSQAYDASLIEENIIRTNLYTELIDMYENMSAFKLKQLHFHLKNNKSFLRFHRPNKYGDDLTGVRETVEYVNKNHKSVFGFEEGRIFNGYRFIYPLEYKGEHIGSVETSISMASIIEELSKEMGSNTDFIIKKSLVDKKVFKEERSNYIEYKTMPTFYHEKSVVKSSDEKLEKLLKKISKTNNFKEKVSKGEFFNFFAQDGAKSFIVNFFPIVNAISKEQVAYIILANNSQEISTYTNQYKIFLAILIALTALITYFIYKIDNEKTKLLKQETVLKEVQKIGHLGYWELNYEKYSLNWSDEVYHIFEINKKKFIPSYENFLTFVYPEDIKRVDEAYKNSIKNKTNYEIEHRIITKKGNIKYISQDCHHTFDEKGNLLQSLGTIHDITNIKQYQKEIENNKKQFESLVSNIPDIVFNAKIDNNLTLKYVNESIKDIVGFTYEELCKEKTSSLLSIVYEDDKKYVKDSIQDMIDKNLENIKIEYRILTKQNNIIWVKNFIKLIDTTNFKYLEGVISDITSQKESYDKLQRFIDTQDSIVILTSGEEINFANKKFFEFFGYKDIQIFKEKHKCINELFIENNRYFYVKDLKANKNWITLIQTLPASQKIVAMVGKDFTVNAFSVTVSKFENDLYIVTFTDISQTMLKHIELEDKTIHDKLTGCLNREYFDSNYKELISKYHTSNSKFGLSILDIDHFKLINDTYGHNLGDFVLKELVKELNSILKKDETLIRWGGEEFILILKVESKQQLFKKLENLRTVIEFHYFKNVRKITASFGATIYEEGEDILKTIKRADRALYSAKANGRNKVILN